MKNTGDYHHAESFWVGDDDDDDDDDDDGFCCRTLIDYCTSQLMAIKHVEICFLSHGGTCFLENWGLPHIGGDKLYF